SCNAPLRVTSRVSQGYGSLAALRGFKEKPSPCLCGRFYSQYAACSALSRSVRPTVSMKPPDAGDWRRNGHLSSPEQTSTLWCSSRALGRYYPGSERNGPFLRSQ